MWNLQDVAWSCCIATTLFAGCNAKSATTGTPEVRPVDEASIARTESPIIAFTDVTKDSGIDFVYQNGSEAGNDSILESLGGGVALVDFDLDGRHDIFLPRGGGFEGARIFGLPGALYRNTGGLRFEDVSGPAGGGFPALHYSHGCFVADYDNDGFPDLLVTGYGGLQLWHNKGDGTFIERHSECGLNDKLWSSAAGWGDVDGDGCLDLYVAHYAKWSFDNHPRCNGPRPELREICSPRAFEPLPDILYRSVGDGTFVDYSAEAGLRLDGKGLGVALGDIDLDGDTDIYVANDTTDNFLYLNNGRGTFEEAAALNGVAVDDRGTPNGSMGVDFGDYNLDGLPDIWAANFEVESFALYRNDGNALFVHVSQATGITALNGLFVGFGTQFTDLDADGDEDLVVTNGHVINYPRNAPIQQLPLVLLNSGGKRFVRLDFANSYFSKPHIGRGLAVGDLDDDGDPDLVFANSQEPVALVRNDTPGNRQWLRVRLLGKQSNRDAIGAMLTLQTSQGDMMRMVKGGTSYLSHSDNRPYWGIPQGAKLNSLEIRWPNDRIQQVKDLSVNRTITVVEEMPPD